MRAENTSSENYEISPRFRKSIEDRIAKLEKDALSDEQVVLKLDNEDHVRRQLRLVEVQRNEAMRLRIFLGRTESRLPRAMMRF